MEIFFALILSSFAMLGAVCLLIIIFRWKTIGGWLPEVWPKIAVEFIQIVSAIATILSAYW